MSVDVGLVFTVFECVCVCQVYLGAGLGLPMSVYGSVLGVFEYQVQVQFCLSVIFGMWIG